MRMKRILFSLICICLFSLQSLAQNIYLVSVGIADYPGTENDLTLPAKDAETIQWIYQKNQKAETILLIDAQATRSNVLSSMTRIFNKASAKDIIVLFFSGHGYKGGFVGYDAMITYQDIKKTMAKKCSQEQNDICRCMFLWKDERTT
ncbi:caspase family protein [Bacteroides sp. CACC 737]|uniref:caspase family protein n=1 Tax=Bacteroides sp. CACC 737 TaxID=2755405 RepID=UPI0015EE736B|nr:caspase family protein [Bacteroides sp. CACC 737]QMI79684.1 caspase family protein [Bacteroides sp. CACC 737]